MKILTTLFIMLLLTSCGKMTDENQSYEPRPNFIHDATFNPYIAKFEFVVKQQTGDASFAIGDIPIVFADYNLMGNENVAGICTTYSDGKRAIEIKRSYWENINETARHVIIQHELGHCRLNRVHNDKLYRGFKLSVMHSQLIWTIDHERMEAFYNYELVTGDLRSFRDFIDSLYE